MIQPNGRFTIDIMSKLRVIEKIIQLAPKEKLKVETLNDLYINSLYAVFHSHDEVFELTFITIT
mgnify:CR=1 FL=1